MRSHVFAALALCFVPSLGSAADFSFMAGEQAFAVAYTAEHGKDASYHVVIISNIGTEPIDILIGKGDRPNGSPYATLAPGASASFVTPNSLFVSCAAKACHIPVEVNYLPAF